MFSIDFSLCELQDLLAFVLLCMKLPEENVIRVESIWSDSYHKIFVVHSQNFTRIFIGKIIHEHLSYQRARKTEIFESLELSCSLWAWFKLKTNLTTVTLAVFLYKASSMKKFYFFWKNACNFHSLKCSFAALDVETGNVPNWISKKMQFILSLFFRFFNGQVIP